jgi:hypothetical protein
MASAMAVLACSLVPFVRGTSSDSFLVFLFRVRSEDLSRHAFHQHGCMLILLFLPPKLLSLESVFHVLKDLGLRWKTWSLCCVLMRLSELEIV